MKPPVKRPPGKIGEKAMAKALTKTIADEIVDFVERAGGPVTLAQIEREVPGFRAHHNATRSWEYVIGEDQDENLIWDGMTEEGCDALRSVLVERRVAIQMAPLPIYWLEGRCPVDQNWTPISLIPAGMANLETPRLLVRGSQEYLDHVMARARDEGVAGVRVLHPAT